MTTESKTNAKNQPSRQPVLLDYLKAYSKDELVRAASQLCIAHSKLTKDALIDKLYHTMLQPETLANRFSLMPNESIKAFEAALEKECFLSTPKEAELLMPFIMMGYIVNYSDNAMEVPQEVRDVYNTVNTPEFQAKRQKLSWLLDCEEAFSILHVVAPVEVFYNMYIQKRGFKISLEEFRALFDELPANFNQCVIRGERIILKDVLQDDFYLKLEESQKKFDFYIPTPKEITALAESRYLRDEPAYKALYKFMREELKQQATYAHLWCYEAYNIFNGGETVTKLLEAIKQKNASLVEAGHPEKQLLFAEQELENRFKALAVKACEEGTRLYCLRGHTLAECDLRLLAQPAQGAQGTGNDRVGAKAKKVYPNDPCPCGSGKKYKKCCGKKK